MSDSGRINLHRKILDWAWYSEINTCRLFIHMLLKANWKEGKFRDTTVPRGSFVSSVSKLAEETSLTNDEVRTAISHLLKTNEITKQSTNKYTVFTVVNYNLYQDAPNQEPSRGTDSAQTITKLFPTIEERNKGIKEIKEINNIICTEPEESVSIPPVISLILNDKSLHGIFQSDIDGWKELYPAVDILQELRKMKGWLDSNPAKRKTKRGIKRFINGWLAREQDSGKNEGRREDVGANNQNWAKAADFYEQFLGSGDSD